MGLACALGQADQARAQAELPLVRVQLRWLHQAQFAGFYVADSLGFYEREGIEVEFVEGGSPVAGAPAIDTLQNLALGGADVAITAMSSALVARRNGTPVVNIAQVFQQSGLGLVCRRAAGVRKPADVRGRMIGVWQVGDQYDLGYWLRHHAIAESDVEIVTQRSDGRDLIDGVIDCGTVMAYNEYGTLLRSGLSPADLFIVRFSEDQSSSLEDGLYTTAGALSDPVRRERLARFLRASAAGWRYAQDNPHEALAVTLIRAPTADPTHQQRMLDAVLRLVDVQRGFGLLDLAALERSVRIVGLGTDDPGGIAAAAHASWTHTVWAAAGLDALTHRSLTPAVQYYLARAVNSTWFHALVIIGVTTFAISGFMQAVQRRYDLWGAFILALLPAAGGGILRDLLIGGDRYPPAAFKDPIYLGLVVAVVAIGTGLIRVLPGSTLQSRAFDRSMVLFDTIGFSALTVVGAQITLTSGLGWYWIPLFAGITVAGGGMLRDIVTGQEPRTFQGELYEEIAVFGGLFLFGALLVANRYEGAGWLVTAAIIATILLSFALRLAAVRYSIRSYRFGMHGGS